MNYKLTGQGEYSESPDIIFSDKKLAETAARAWNAMAAIHDPDCINIDRYEVEEIKNNVISSKSELIEYLRKFK